jgi:hypothetical protein
LILWSVFALDFWFAMLLWMIPWLHFWCVLLEAWSSVSSVRIETEPNWPKPNLLGSSFSKEPIGQWNLDNRISLTTEEQNDRFG